MSRAAGFRRGSWSNGGFRGVRRLRRRAIAGAAPNGVPPHPRRRLGAGPTPDGSDQVLVRLGSHRRTAGAVRPPRARHHVRVLVAAALDPRDTDGRCQEPVPAHPAPTADRSNRGSKTIIAEIGPGDIRGWELRGSLTNADPGFEGAADLPLTVEAGGLSGSQSQIVQFCNGNADTWWVLTLDLGGVDGQHNPDGSMQDGTRGMYGRCSPDDPTAVPPASGDIGPWQWDEAVRSSPMRMFVTDELPAAARQCIAGTDTYGCLATHAVEPSEDTDATFGFGVYEHLRGTDRHDRAERAVPGALDRQWRGVPRGPGVHRRPRRAAARRTAAGIGPLEAGGHVPA